jgi:prepilin-type N-terminal cleavage/methylation domain-containing protein
VGVGTKVAGRSSSSERPLENYTKAEMMEMPDDSSCSGGFSLLELLTVTAIIGLLTAMVLPAVSRARVKTKTQQARMEMAEIVAAITEYDAAYNRFPVSRDAIRAAAISNEDITYGGVIEETHSWLAGPGYLTNNSEIMAVLLDMEYYGDGAPTINQKHTCNPQHTRFILARQPGGTNALPGIGIDGIYRDPWGSPYVITLDLNRDGRARDIMYRDPVVSSDPITSQQGLFGLVKGADIEGKPAFELPGSVMVWSAGPDRRLSTKQRANEGVNRDNILSWTR